MRLAHASLPAGRKAVAAALYHKRQAALGQPVPARRPTSGAAPGGASGGGEDADDDEEEEEKERWG